MSHPQLADRLPALAVMALLGVLCPMAQAQTAGPDAAAVVTGPAGRPAAAAVPNPSLYQLTQRLLKSESAVSTAVMKSRSAGVEDLLAENYDALQQLCKKQFDDLERDIERYKTAEARTNLLGSLLALLGSVATYAPGKTVLMGLGLSSSSSGTVSSGITQFFSERSATDETRLSILRNQLVLMFDRYDSVEPDRDPTGARRRAIMARAKGICLGLTSLDGQASGQADGKTDGKAGTAPEAATGATSPAGGASAPG